MDLALINDDISRQKSISHNLHSQRNHLAPISRLPTDLLESIFIRLACDNFCGDAPRVGRWVHISHVSSHWRNVALNCPILWSYILFTSQYWIDVFLAISAQAPLKLWIDVHYQVDSCKLSEFIDKILEHAERIEELHFYTRCWNKLTSQCFATLYSSASRLRVLIFSMKPFTSSFYGVIPPYHFPRTLRGVTTLSLRFNHPFNKTCQDSKLCSVACQILYTFISTVPLRVQVIPSAAQSSIRCGGLIYPVFHDFGS